MVATPGAEPVAADGYAVVVLLDTWLLLARDRPARRRGGAAPLVQRGRRWSGPAAGRWPSATRPSPPCRRWCGGTSAGFAGREVDGAPGGPPAAGDPGSPPLTGEPGALDDALTLLALPAAAEVLGPLPRCREPTTTRSGPWSGCRGPQGAALSAALGELQRVRSARKLDPVRIQVDPVD